MKNIIAITIFTFYILLSQSIAKEVALTFDDAPNGPSLHFTSLQRTQELIKKLKDLNVPEVMIFANACKGRNIQETIFQLKKYTEAGHLIENHSCSHFRLDEVGFKVFSEDAEKGDQLLKSLYAGQNFFRYPYLNEGKDVLIRDQMREWLKKNNYRNAPITGDNEDPTFSAKINQAKKLGKKIDYEKIKTIFLDHIISSLECNDKLAIDNFNRSPKHVLLLHEADATVMFIDDLVAELRKKEWKIINASKAYEDPIYFELPKNTYAGSGLIAQMVFEKTGKKESCYDYSALVRTLNKALELKNN